MAGTNYCKLASIRLCLRRVNLKSLTTYDISEWVSIGEIGLVGMSVDRAVMWGGQGGRLFKRLLLVRGNADI
jgi:hypothetical protein